MAKATEKSQGIENFLTSIIGQPRQVSISQDRCVPSPIGCGGEATEFRDEISRREFSISGLCQKCQDAFFGSDK